MVEPSGGSRSGAPILSIDDLLSLKEPCRQHAVALSPDGSLLAVALTGVGESRTRRPAASSELPRAVDSGARLVICDLQSGRVSEAAPDQPFSWRPSWSRSGDKCAFYAGDQHGVHLWCWEATSAVAGRVSPERIFAHGFALDVPQWSPDGAELFVPVRPVLDDPPAPNSRPEDDATVDVLGSPEDEANAVGGALPSGPQHCRAIAAIELATGRVRRLLEGFEAEHVTLSPDGAFLAVSTLPVQPDVSVQRVVSSLYLLPAEGGALRQVPGELSSGVWGRHDPAWSPDSTRVAFVSDGHLHLYVVESAEVERVAAPTGLSETMLWWHPHGDAVLARDHQRRLWFVPVEPTSDPVQLAPSPPAVQARYGTGVFWSTDERSCITAGRSGGQRGFYRVPLDGSPAEPLWTCAATLEARMLAPVFGSMGDVSGDGSKVVFAVHDTAQPRQIWVADSAFEEPRVAVDFNPHFRPESLGTDRQVTWTCADGAGAAGRLLLPPVHHGSTNLPTILCIYPGGYAAALMRSWDSLDCGLLNAQLLASRGYAVCFVDIPAAAAGWRATLDELDNAVPPAIDALVAAGVADPDRIGVMGHSAGGQAVNLLITRMPTLAVAVASAGTANVTSAYGMLRVDDDGQPQTPGVHAHPPPYSDADAAINASPVFHLDKVKTPLLLIHGIDDDGVGIEQAGEMFTGLRSLGKTATLLRYRGEGHVPTDFSHANKRHATDQVLEWFDKYLH